MKPVAKLLAGILLAMLTISLIQWVAFHKAGEHAESLPCNYSLEVYNLETVSFLPPNDILDRAIGYRGTHGDVSEILVEGRYGHRNWLYEIYLNSSGNRLSGLVGDLRAVLNNGSTEEVEERFWALEIEYFTFKALQNYGRNNITEVAFRPSPPLSTLLSLKNFILEFKNILVAPLVSFVIIGAIFLWLILVGKVRISSGPVRFILALMLALLVFLPTVEGLVYVLKHVGLGENSYSGQTGKCGLLELHPDYDDFWDGAVDHIRKDDHNASCEVVDFLSQKLTKNEIESLKSTLNLTCS